MDVLRALEIVAPMRTRTERISSRATPVWITPEVRDARRESRRLERRYHATNSEEDYIRWRKAGRSAVKTTNLARVKYYRDAIQSAGSDSKRLWGTVKKLLHSYTRVQRLDSATALKRAQSFLSFLLIR